MTKFRRGQNQKNQGDPFNTNFNPERRNWRKRDNNPPPPPPLAHMPPPYAHGMNNNAGMSPGVGMGMGMGMGMGNYYYPGGGMSPMPHMSPMPYPSPVQPSPVHPAARPAAVNMHDNLHGNQNAIGTATSAATVPGYPNRYYPRQSQPPRAASASPKSSDDIPSVAHWAKDVAKHHLVDETSVNEATLTARVDQSADEEKRLFLEEYRYAGPQAQYEPPNCPKFTESDLEKEKGTSTGGSGNSLEKEKASGTSSKSKLRGDAPEFVPQKKRQPWMIVSSF